MGHLSQIRNLPVPEKCHSLFGYNQFSGTGKFRLWLGHPITVHCPPCSRPICMCPPHLRSPSSLHRQGVPKVSWPPPFPGPPHAHTPLHVGRPTRVAAAFVPPRRAPSPHCAQTGVQEGLCARLFSSARATPPQPPIYAPRPTLPAHPP